MRFIIFNRESALRMKAKLLNILLPFALLPLMACGQTPVQNHPGKTAAASGSSTTATTQTAAGDDVSKTITNKLESVYGGQGQQQLKVLSINTTPVSGLYEVVVTGNQVIYTDATANYMLVGDLIDVNTRKSLTEEKNAELNKVDFSQLPLDKAIKEVRGNGKLKVAVFSDADCPFCKRLEAEFAQMTDITIYSFMMPIASLHPNAHARTVQLWCQPDRTAAWTNWMRKGQMPPQVAECNNPITETTELGEKLGFSGTPTLVFPNGKVQSGYAPKAQLETILKANQ